MAALSQLQAATANVLETLVDGERSVPELTRDELAALRRKLGFPTDGPNLGADVAAPPDADAGEASLRDRALLLENEGEERIAPELAPALVVQTLPTSVLLVDARGDLCARPSTWYGLGDLVYLEQVEDGELLRLRLLDLDRATSVITQAANPARVAGAQGELEGWPAEQNADLDEILAAARTTTRFRLTRIEDDDVTQATLFVVCGERDMWLVSGAEIPNVGARSTAIRIDGQGVREAVRRMLAGAPARDRKEEAE